MSFTRKSLIVLLSMGLLGYLFIGLFLPTASGQTMSNKDYTIQTQGLNAISGSAGNSDYKVRSTVGELSPVVSEGVNFKVRSGFENTVSALPFSVSLSSDLVDFGSLSPTNPIIRTVDLSVYSLSSYGYSVLASEDHALKSEKGSIPDTTCDNGDCNQENASVWTNLLTYGFGYRCDNAAGIDCDNSFSNSKFYKHFADISNEQSSQSVMAGIGSKNKDVRLSYKVNISRNQAEGIYNNTITYIAVPNF